MVDINVNKNQGLISAIKTKLNAEQIDTSKCNASIWSQVLEQVTIENEQNKKEGKSLIYHKGNDLNGDGHSNFVIFQGVIKFSQKLWDNICRIVKGEAIQNNTQAETPQNISQAEDPIQLTATQQQRLQQHKEVVQKSIEIIKAQFDACGLGDKFKGTDKDLFLQCLDEIQYEADNKDTGSGFAKWGKITIQTNNETLNTTAQMVKLLIHEANHAFKQRKAEQNGTLNFPTKEEEMECETLALTTTAKMVGKIDGMDDYEIYGHNISYYQKEALVQNDNGIINWLDGYSHLADNTSGDITITHLKDMENASNNNSNSLKIQSGDIIKVGDTEYTIGENAYLEGLNYTSVMQLIMHRNASDSEEVRNSGPELYGHIIFDDMQPTEYEKQELKKANSDYTHGSEGIKFTITRGGKTITGTFYPA